MKLFRTRIFCIALFALFALFGWSTLAAHASVSVGNSPLISLQNDLQGYWTFDGQHTNLATGVVYDQSGKGRHGTLSIGLPTPQNTSSTFPAAGVIGQAISLGGPESYSKWVDFGAAADLSGISKMSIAFWAKRKADATSAWAQLVGKIADDSGWGLTSNDPVIGIGQSNLAFFTEGPSNEGYTTSNPLKIGQWVYVTVVFDGTQSTNAGKLKIYTNGIEEALTFVGTLSATITGNTNLLLAYEDANARIFNGDIDDLRIYTRALSPREVGQLYKLGRATIANSPVTSLQSGLVGYWTMDGQHTNWATGQTFDQSGRGNTGTLTSMSSTTSPVVGKIGQAFAFPGVTGSGADYVLIPRNTSLNLTTGVTMCAWIFPRSGTNNGIISKSAPVSGASTAQPDYGLIIPGANLVRWVVNQQTATIQSTANGMPRGKWTYVCGTYNKVNLVLYLNGVFNGKAAYTTDITDTASSQTHVGVYYSTTYVFDGLVDDARVYNRALSAREIQQLYKLGQATFANSPLVSLQSGLQGYWTMDGQHTNWSTGTVYDQSGRGNNGTMTNMATATVPVIGKIGQAFMFDGSDDTVSIGTMGDKVLTENGAATISVWVNPLDTEFRRIVTRDISAGFNFDLATNGQVRFSYQGTTSLIRNSVTTTVPLARWTHIVATWDGSTTASNVHIYANGVEVNYATTQNGVGLFDNSADSVVIGNLTLGKLDDVRIYDRTLSPREAQALYNLGR